jgi:hypothetical protein
MGIASTSHAGAVTDAVALVDSGNIVYTQTQTQTQTQTNTTHAGADTGAVALRTILHLIRHVRSASLRSRRIGPP